MEERLKEGNLFGDANQTGKDNIKKPLAERMRPSSLDGFLGQEHLLSNGKPLKKLIEKDLFGSIIFWGPPGSGKTTLARITAKKSGSKFIALSAVESGIKELKTSVKEAKFNRSNGKRTILFIDEIHRYSKTQQDALLPHVESGLITLIGATTENPSFGVIPALRSRATIFELKPLPIEKIESILKQALADKESGLGTEELSADDNVISRMALLSGGDARVALSILEASANAIEGRTITESVVEEISQKSFLLYDRVGQSHYDHASAFQKSLRGSDPDASIYWMARMLEAGEDPRYIARRLIVTASEDVGNADPTALILAVSASDAVEKLGLPEGRYALSQAVLYVALAPKSNSAKAVDRAISKIRESGSNPQVPFHLRDLAYKRAVKGDAGKEYDYPHDHKDNWTKQQYLPDGLKEEKFFTPSQNGREAKLAERLKSIKGD